MRNRYMSQDELVRIRCRLDFFLCIVRGVAHGKLQFFTVKSIIIDDRILCTV